MRAITIKAPGKSGNVALADLPDPTPGPGEIAIDVAYGGCNFADLMLARGTYPHPKGYPFVAGLEVSGRVARLGADVHGFAVGDPVAAIAEAGGAFAERCVVPAERAIRLPGAMALDLGAAFPIQALTAWHMLHNVTTTKPGDVVLVHAVGGGVGLHLTQLAKRAGAVVIGTVGTPGKERRPLDYGADKVVNRASVRIPLKSPGHSAMKSPGVPT
jgi:NADPH2:quinone reductase